MLLRVVLSCLIAITCFSRLSAQVSNDDIKRLENLSLNENPVFTNTANSSVQWKCINKALTEKCIKYHNDQWFSFHVNQDGLYFLNISNQKCRDVNHGIQVLIIEGNPCETQTYRTYKCIAKLDPDNIFIRMDSLKRNTSYLLNIDGFLGDFCEFNVQLSTTAKGLPGETIGIAGNSTMTNRNIIYLKWHVNNQQVLTLGRFEVWRRNARETMFTQLKNIPLRRNTFGQVFNDYDCYDTVNQPGTYHYKIIAADHQDSIRTLVDESVLEWKLPIAKQVIKLLLDYKNGTSLQIIVTDLFHDIVLKETSFKFDRKKDLSQTINLTEYWRNGISKIEIVVLNLRTRTREVHRYTIDPNGEIVKSL